MVNNTGFPVGQAPIIVIDTGLPTNQFRTFLINVWQRVQNIGSVSGWATPTGTGSRATFNADWTTTVSNPPTQAEMTAVRDQLIAVQKRLAQLIIDLDETGVIG